MTVIKRWCDKINANKTKQRYRSNKNKWLTVAILIIIVIVVLISLITLGRKLVYKTDYSDIVYKYATEYNLDPNFLFAVIKTESNFNKDAISNVGARGLMQIMPDTYEWINSKLKEKDRSYDDMFDPEHNIRFGGYLYSALFTEFSNYESSIAAYHAGRGAVNKWLADSKYSDDNLSLDKIPISDTAHYVQKVMKNYEQYKKIYKNR